MNKKVMSRVQVSDSFSAGVGILLPPANFTL